MLDAEMLKVIADLEPGVKEALDSYVQLQWTKYLIETGGGVLAFCLLGLGIFYVVMKVKNA